MRRPAPTLPVAVLALLALACVLAPALTVAGVHSPLRVAAALALFAFAPGAALLPWLARRESGAEPALVIAVSLALSLVVTQAMLWAGAWAPVVAACALGGACLVSLVAQIAARREEWS
jgi:hypothetical protein